MIDVTRWINLTVGLVFGLALLGCSGAARRPAQARYGAPELTGPGVVVATAGDIACDPKSRNYNRRFGTTKKCHMKATSDLLLSIHPTAVLTLGDNQYQRGELRAFLESYDSTWGRLKATTHPVPGNHEYWTAAAAGYFAYFGDAAGLIAKGYYSFDLGDWHLIALNSNCGHVGGCGLGSPQERWLHEDLRLHQGKCVLAYWHHARFSSGIHGSNRAYDPFWRDLYEAGADIVLSGHDHHYERFAPLNPEGKLDQKRGLREFVVGTGGKGGWRGFYRFLPFGDRRNPNSEVQNSDTFGVLVLTLRPAGYQWRFLPEPGETFTDSGTGLCHTLTIH
jgi:hypothetical protein